MSKRRRFLAVLAALLAPVLLLAGLLGFALATRPGLHMLLTLTNSLGDGRIQVRTASGRLGSACTLEGLRLRLSGMELDIDRLALTWHPAALFRRELHVGALQLGGIRVRLPADGASGPETDQPSPPQLPVFTWPLALRIERLALDEVQLLAGEEEAFALTLVEAEQVRAQGQDLHFGQVAVKNSWMEVRARGQIRSEAVYPLRVGLDYAFDFTGYGPIRGQGNLAGDLAGTVAVAGTLSEPQPVQLQGRVQNVLDGLQWQAEAQSPQLALERVHGGWPVLELRQVRVQGHGDIRSYALAVAAQAQWPRLLRPVDVQGRLQVGTSGLLVQELSVADAVGQLKLSGSLDWSPFVQWQAKARARDIHPDLVVADLPGALGGDITSRGSLRAEGLEAELQFDGISGRLRNYPLHAGGNLVYRNGALDLHHIHAAIGRATFDLDGTVREKLALDFALQAPDLQELLPQLAGSLQAGARVTGSRQEPVLEATLAGQGLALGTTGRIQTLAGRIQGALSGKAELQAQLRAEQLQLGTVLVETVQAQLRGSPADHVLRLQARTRKEKLGLELAGHRQDAAWTGEVRQLQLDLPPFGRWRQRKAATLELGPEQARLGRLCAAMEASSLCIQGQWQKEEGNWQGSARLAALPLERVQRWLPQTMRIDGVLEMEAELSGRGGELRRGRVLAHTPGLRLDFLAAGAPVQHLLWEEHRLEVMYRDRGLTTNWNSVFKDGGQLRVQLASGPLPPTGEAFRQAPLAGRVEVDLRELALLNAITRQQSRWSGALRGSMQLGGSMATPVFSGTVQLEDGEVLVPELGLQLSPVQLAISGSDGLLNAVLRAHARQGQLQVEAGVDYGGDTVRLQPVTVRGDSFRVADQPGRVMDISPDIRVDIGPERIDVSGRVDIPYARIETIGFASTITPSGDVVVVDDPPRTSRGAIPLHVRLLAAAGKDVLIDTYGLRGRIGGRLQLLLAPGRAPAGNGQLTLRDASFSLYGKRLKINTGRLLFSGGALTNPGIEIRSENTADNATVGFRVDGFLKTPRVTLYSRPVMDQGAIVSRLIEDTNSVGGSSRDDIGLVGDTAKRLGMGGLVPYLEDIKRFSMVDDIRLDTRDDKASLVFGSWLTPDFYVSYGKSLTGEGGTFNVRYVLGKGFVVETESSESRNSGDIKYEFEH